MSAILFQRTSVRDGVIAASDGDSPCHQSLLVTQSSTSASRRAQGVDYDRSPPTRRSRFESRPGPRLDAKARWRLIYGAAGDAQPAPEQVSATYTSPRISHRPPRLT